MSSQQNWHLGQTSQSYESGGGGPGTISSGGGDYGGVSYGTYQLSLNSGTLGEYLKQSIFKSNFEGLQPGTPEFNAEWIRIADSNPRFGQDQHDFIKTTHYDIQAKSLKSDGVDLSNRGSAVQDALWSTSVQFGSRTPAIFEKGLEEKFGENYKLSNLTDKDIVGAVQDYKSNHNNSLFKHSPKQWQSLLDRATNEKMDLEALADGRGPDPSKHVHTSRGHRQHDAHMQQREGAVLKQGMHGDSVKRAQDELHELGYLHADPDGRFGPQTKAATEEFQRAQSLESDGEVGPVTQARLDSAVQEHRATVRDQQISDFTSGLQPLRDFNDSCHPQNALYNTLKDGFPSDASPELLARSTAACYMAGIRQSDDLGNVVGGNGNIVFESTSIFANDARVDLTQPTPSVQQTMQQVQQFDRAQAQNHANIQAQNAQINAQAPQGSMLGCPPTPGGPF